MDTSFCFSVPILFCRRWLFCFSLEMLLWNAIWLSEKLLVEVQVKRWGRRSEAEHRLQPGLICSLVKNKMLCWVMLIHFLCWHRENAFFYFTDLGFTQMSFCSVCCSLKFPFIFPFDFVNKCANLSFQSLRKGSASHAWNNNASIFWPFYFFWLNDLLLLVFY